MKIQKTILSTFTPLSQGKVYQYTKNERNAVKTRLFDLYRANLSRRGVRNVKFTPKEQNLMRFLFEWLIMDENFKGDLNKGIYIASGQGFGKDIMADTFYQYLQECGKHCIDMTFSQFNDRWYNGIPQQFNGFLKINDVNEYGFMKRERESIPF